MLWAYALRRDAQVLLFVTEKLAKDQQALLRQDYTEHWELTPMVLHESLAVR